MAKFSFGQGVKLALSVAAIASFVGFAPAAHAAAANSLLLCISDTDFGCFGSSAGNSVSVYWSAGGGLTTAANGSGVISADPLSHDTSSNVDGVTVIATLGNFSLNIDTGTYMGPGNAMDFNLDNILASGAGNLFIVFGADTYSGGAPFHLNGSATLGTGVTSVTDTACFEAGNGGYGICPASGAIGSASITSTGAISFNSSAKNGSSTFGLEQDVEISFSKAGQVSGDLQLVPAPEPTSILLFGGALVFACGAIRRKIQS